VHSFEQAGEFHRKPTAYLEPTEDFSTAVERGKLIKDRIRQSYSEMFPADQMEEQAKHAREIVQYASLATKFSDLYNDVDKFSRK